MKKQTSPTVKVLAILLLIGAVGFLTYKVINYQEQVKIQKALIQSVEDNLSTTPRK